MGMRQEICKTRKTRDDVWGFGARMGQETRSLPDLEGPRTRKYWGLEY